MNKLYIKENFILHSSEDIKIIWESNFQDFVNYITDQSDHDDEYYCSCNKCAKCTEKEEKIKKNINTFLMEHKIEKVFNYNNRDSIFEEADKENIYSYLA
jgi:hypothetical protein